MKHEIISKHAKNNIWLSELNSIQYEILEKIMEEYASYKIKNPNKKIDNHLYEEYYENHYKDFKP